MIEPNYKPIQPDSIAAGSERSTLFFVILLLLLAFAGQSGAATADTACPIANGYADMYNLAFHDAHGCFATWERGHPDDPLGPVSNAAAYLFSEFDRLHILQSEFFVSDTNFFHRDSAAADPQVKKEFEAELERSRTLADAKLQASANDANALLASVMRLGLQADYLALIEKRYFASLDDVKQSRQFAERLLSIAPDCYDAYLAVGVENYLLSLKAAPVRWFLRAGGAQTDKATGLRNLRLTADKGNYLQPYAQLLLAVAAMRDKDDKTARSILSDLSRRYPQNRLYREELAKMGD